MKVVIEISGIVADDVLGFTYAIGAPLDTFDEKKQKEIVDALTKKNIFEKMPGSFVAEAIVNKQYPVQLLLSENEEVAKQQRNWVSVLIKASYPDVQVVTFEEVKQENTLLITGNRDRLVYHGARSGSILPYTDNSQMHFILETIEGIFNND